MFMHSFCSRVESCGLLRRVIGVAKLVENCISSTKVIGSFWRNTHTDKYVLSMHKSIWQMHRFKVRLAIIFLGCRMYSILKTNLVIQLVCFMNLIHFICGLQFRHCHLMSSFEAKTAYTDVCVHCLLYIIIALCVLWQVSGCICLWFLWWQVWLSARPQRSALTCLDFQPLSPPTLWTGNDCQW